MFSIPHSNVIAIFCTKIINLIILKILRYYILYTVPIHYNSKALYYTMIYYHYILHNNDTEHNSTTSTCIFIYINMILMNMLS